MKKQSVLENKEQNHEEPAAFVGIDWADKVHAVTLQEAATN